jgi:GNAT superfamily N-acetyltransferase
MIPETTIEDFQIRFASPEDVGLILQFIKDLAEYEHMSDQVAANEELLMEFIFRQKKAEVIIGEYQQEPVCFALFFHNFSTFLGRPGIYLEDLFVKPSMRGKGFGKAIFSFLSRLVEERNCGRLEWACLDWNEPSIQFYKKMGAAPMEDWTVYRII